MALTFVRSQLRIRRFLALQGEIHEALRRRADFSSPVWLQASAECLSFLASLLHKDPLQRITLARALQHPWVKKNTHPGTSARVRASRSTPVARFDLRLPASAEAASLAPTGSLLQGDDLEDATAVSRSLSEAAPPARPLSSKGPRGMPSTATAETSSVFAPPENFLQRIQVCSFVDIFRSLEAPYLRLLRAPSAAEAAIAYEAFRGGLRKLNEFLDASNGTGPFFLGSEPSYAEAATAPSLFRMAACLRDVRGIDVAAACSAMRLTRLAAWAAEVLARPAACCSTSELAACVVQMARKLHVTYSGPPAPVIDAIESGIPDPIT